MKLGCTEQVNSVNTLSFYNLSPGTTSQFRDIRVCKDLCPELVFDTVPLRCFNYLNKKSPQAILNLPLLRIIALTPPSPAS